jgi:hypothetical protein
VISKLPVLIDIGRELFILDFLPPSAHLWEPNSGFRRTLRNDRRACQVRVRETFHPPSSRHATPHRPSIAGADTPKTRYLTRVDPKCGHVCSHLCPSTCALSSVFSSLSFLCTRCANFVPCSRQRQTLRSHRHPNSAPRVHFLYVLNSIFILISFVFTPAKIPPVAPIMCN